MRTRKKTRDAIIESALRLFAERGYEAVRVEDLAHAAGVSRATFYNHFSEREEVLSALFARLLASEGDVADAAAEDVPPLQRISAVAEDAVRRMLQQEELARFVYSLPVRHESLLRPDVPSTPWVFLTIHHLLEAAAARGELRTDVPVDLICAHVHNALEAGMRAWAEGRTDNPGERVRMLIDMALHGVVVPDAEVGHAVPGVVVPGTAHCH